MKKSFKPLKALTALLLLGSVQAMDFTSENPDKDTVSKAFQKVDIKPFKPKNIFKGDYKYEVEGAKPQEKLTNQKTPPSIPLEDCLSIEERRNNSIKSVITGLIPQTTPSKEIPKEQPLSPSEDRQRVEKVKEFPSSTNVLLKMLFGPNDECRGSGVMIGPYHVLTAGHNVYDKNTGEWASLVTAFLGADESKDSKECCAHFGSSLVVKAFIPQKYQEGDVLHDLAILILQKNLGVYTGWAGIQAPSDDVFSDEDLKFYVSGYPGEKKIGQLWEMKGEIALPGEKVLKYKIPTSPGQSGSPVWRKTKPPMVVGIHVRGEEVFNEGTRITAERLDWILSCLGGGLTSSSALKSLQETSTQPLKETPKTKEPEKKESNPTLSKLQDAPYPQILSDYKITEDLFFEAIVVERTRFGNSITMVDLETAELLDVPAIIAFNSLPKFKTEEEQTSSLGFQVSDSPSISYNSGKTSKYTINIDEFKKVYQMTSDTFYRGSDFSLKYNQDDGDLFLQDLTILDKGVSLTSVSQGTNTKDNAKLLKSIMKSIMGEDATKLPKKVHVVFGFGGTEKTPLAVQMRLIEKKNRFFTKDKGVAEWIINFVRSKNKDIVVSLMNGTLLKNMNAPDD